MLPHLLHPTVCSWDIILRAPYIYPEYASLPTDFWMDWVIVAEDEARVCVSFRDPALPSPAFLLSGSSVLRHLFTYPGSQFNPDPGPCPGLPCQSPRDGTCRACAPQMMVMLPVR